MCWPPTRRYDRHWCSRLTFSTFAETLIPANPNLVLSAIWQKPVSPVSTRVQNHHIWVILLSTRPSPLCRLHLLWSLVSSYRLTINHSPLVEVAATCMRRMQFLKYDNSTLYNPCFSLQKALTTSPPPALSDSSMQGVSREEEGHQITASTQDVDVIVCAKPHWTAPMTTLWLLYKVQKKVEGKKVLIWKRLVLKSSK